MTPKEIGQYLREARQEAREAADTAILMALDPETADDYIWGKLDNLVSRVYSMGIMHALDSIS